MASKFRALWRAGAVALVAALVCGCGKAPWDAWKTNSEDSIVEPTGPVTRPDMIVDSVATGEPGKDRFQWTAGNDATRGVTGNLTASLPEGRSGPLVLAFATGVTLRLNVLGVHKGSVKSGAPGLSLAKSLGGDDEAGVYVYAVDEERVARSAPKGGLCGRAQTTFVAVSEYVSGEGEWSFRLAAFKGANPPGPDAVADPEPCQAYVYQLS